MRKTPLKRGTKQLKRSGFKRKTAVTPKKSLKPLKRAKLPTLKRLRDKTDNLLTPICKKISPYCESCGMETQVGHHWIEKSRSSFLRYDLRNIIALCHSCHAKIHNRFGNSIVGGLDVAEIIINKRGRDWKIQLDKDQKIEQQVNREYYVSNYERLKKMHDSL